MKQNYSDQRKSENNQDSDINEDISIDELQLLRIKNQELEQARLELIDLIEINKSKAKSLLIKKDV